MRKIIRIATIPSFFHLSPAFCYNPTLLEFNADSINECIWSKISIPAQKIQENLGFLDPETDDNYVQQYNKKNIFNEYEGTINRASNSVLKNFFDNCKEVYNFYEDRDTFARTAVQILFERVFQKHEDRANTLLSTKHLLPVIRDSDDNDEAFPQQKSTLQTLLKEIPLEYQPMFRIIIIGIANNFFPDIFQEKLTLEEVSLKCGVPLEELKKNYEHYLQLK